MKSERADAVQAIVTLARQHGISVPEIAAALGTTGAGAKRRSRRAIVQLLGYLGGTFVFAGIGVFVALQWDAMNAAARVVVTLGSGIAAFALALLAARDERFTRAATPFFVIAAALEPTGLLVAFSEFGTGGDWRWAGLVTSGAVAAQFGTVFAVLRASTPLFLAVAFTTLFWLTVFDLLDVDGGVTALTIGGSLLLAAIGIGRTRHRDLTPVWYLAGSAAFLYGLFDIVEGTMFELGFLAAAAAFVYLAAFLRSRTLLFVATMAVLAYTGWYTGKYFADSAGWPLALIAFGLVMIGLSALAVRIDRDYVRGATKGKSQSTVDC
jgi:hypothetical protein